MSSYEARRTSLDTGRSSSRADDHIHEDAAAAADYHNDSYQSAPDDQLVPPPGFRSFFTLIQDENTGEHYHPTVHYIFSDEDADFLTSSIVDSLESDNDNPNHRLLLVDVDHDGRSIRSAHSLSKDWQVLNAACSSAPSWTGAGPESASENLMLKIEGAASQTKPSTQRRQSIAEDVVAQMENDIQLYTDRLAHLQKVLSKSSVL
jgi:hypothetical protein